MVRTKKIASSKRTIDDDQLEKVTGGVAEDVFANVELDELGEVEELDVDPIRRKAIKRKATK